MRACWRRLSLLCLSSALVAVVLWAGEVSAQDSSDGFAGAAIAGTMMMFFLVFAVGMYIYVALALQTIANKTGTLNAWLAWIPIANIILMLNIARKPLWWFVLCLIPVVNLVMIVIIWMGVAEAVTNRTGGAF